MIRDFYIYDLNVHRFKHFRKIRRRIRAQMKQVCSAQINQYPHNIVCIGRENVHNITQGSIWQQQHT